MSGQKKIMIKTGFQFMAKKQFRIEKILGTSMYADISQNALKNQYVPILYEKVFYVCDKKEHILPQKKFSVFKNAKKSTFEHTTTFFCQIFYYFFVTFINMFLQTFLVFFFIRKNVFLPPLPKVGCPIFREIRNSWGKVK